MQSIEFDSLKNSTIQSYMKGREKGLVEGKSSAVAAFKASPEYAEEVFRHGTFFYANGFIVCAKQFKNLGDLPLNFNYSFLDMRAYGYGRIGGVGGSGPSEGS
ncbi:hypothetical protein Salat_1813700 [Sesamum alatum]|uniref:Uncharacterized protein n=1 Tax=Sesamum alatum TaxID=300844 RepID=A0AAE2CHK4_9LAMI|nr:hypothetical protein Salat_1813700 [Sesamum alatum]